MRLEKTLFSRVVVLLLAVSWGLMGATDAVSQEQPGDPPQEPEVASPTTSEGKTAWDRLIYLPYKNAREILNRDKSQIVLPYSEYIRLWRIAQDLGRTEKTAKTLITKADYQAQVVDDWVKIEASFEVQSLEEGLSELPLGFQNVAIGKLTSDNEKVLLRSDDSGKYFLIVPGKGTYTVGLEFSSRIKKSPQGQHLSCGIPSVAMATFALTIPEADQDVQLAPHLGNLPIESADGTTQLKAQIGATNRITANWHPRASLKPEMDLLTSVNNQIEVTVDESVVHTMARLKYQVLRGELTETQIVAGNNVRILDVTAVGATIKTWKVEKQEKQQVVLVEWLSPVKKEVTLEVQAESKLSDEPFSVAGIVDENETFGIHALGAVREAGQVTVSSVPSMSIGVEEQENLIRVNEATTAEVKTSKQRLAYKFFHPRFSLKIRAQQIQPHIAVYQDCHVLFKEDELQVRTKLNYKITKAGVFGFTVQIPKGLTVDNVQCPGLAKYNVDSQSNRLEVSLQAKHQGPISLTIQSHQTLDADDYKQFQSLPIPNPEATDIETGRVSVYASESLEIVADEGKVTGARPDFQLQPIEPVNQQQAVAQPSQRFLAAWAYHRRPLDIPVRRVRKPTRLTANVTTAVTFNLELIEVRSRVDFLVEHSSQNMFRIAVPEAVADQVSIRPLPNASSASVRIQQKVRSEKAEEGMVAWTITLQQRVIGQQSFEVRYDWKPKVSDAQSNAGDTSGKQQKLSAEIPLVRVLGSENGSDEETKVELARVVGEIAIRKDRALSLTSEAKGPEVETIDIRELKQADSEAHWAFRYTQQPVTLNLDAVRYDVQDVIRTVISRALVEIAVGQGSDSVYRCRYRVRSSERQRLSIDLPAGMKPLAVWVDQKPIKLEVNETAKSEEGWTSYLINIARQTSSQDEFYLTFQFLSEATADAFNEQGGKLQLKMPRIESGNDDAVVQQLKTVVWVPDKVALVNTPKDFLAERDGDTRLLDSANSGQLQKWIGGENIEMLDFPRQGHAYSYKNFGGADQITVTWWKMSFYTAWISGALVVLAFLLRGITWENKISLLLVVCLAAVLFALFDYEAVFHVVMAARYGIVALLAVWLIHTVFQWNRQPQNVLAAAGGHGSHVLPADSSENLSATKNEVGENVADDSSEEPSSDKEMPPEE